MNETVRWKLYWCETDDHDEDWFVVAQDEEEAAHFHEVQEGYDDGEATAELVCALPPPEQRKYDEANWPGEETLLACGAEMLPVVRQDGQDALRAQLGSGSRAVRLNGVVYVEGDIVSNSRARIGLDEGS